MIADLITSLEQLLSLSQQLGGSIAAQKNFAAWVQLPDGEASFNQPAQSAAIKIFNQYQYLDEQPSRNTITMPGLLACTAETLSIATQLNAAKQRFEKLMQQLKTEKIKRDEESLTASIEQILKLRNVEAYETLNRHGLARLNLRQCYRQITVLEQKPLKVSWSWANTRAIKKIKTSKAIEMLLKRPDSDAKEVQLAKLQTLTADTLLAQVQQLTPHRRVNLVFKEQDQIRRQMIKGSLPILYPDLANQKLPDFRPCSAQPSRADRLERLDKKIEEEVFIPSLRIHRYIENN
ncbi:DNA replication terminus site-binding protein [Pelagibaculum spongiae]|nr:hypothetical protein [Pelagibaculum spongiae]